MLEITKIEDQGSIRRIRKNESWRKRTYLKDNGGQLSIMYCVHSHTVEVFVL